MSLIKGHIAEDAALLYLTQQGLKLVTKNFRSRWGEIDLIMQHPKSLVFVEVRYRKSSYFGGGSASVDARKQRKLIRTALYYLQQQKMNNAICRFDVISLSTTETGETSIDWIKNAFDASV